jgi:uncharacterized membrane protein
MSTFWLLCLLGIVGAVNGSAADVLCVKAAQQPQNAWWMVGLASAMFCLSGPIWYVMSRLAGGKYTEPAIAWTIASTFTVLIAIRLCDGQQTPRQWFGVALILMGALVRG